MQQVLSFRITFKDDGTIAGFERVARGVDRVEKEADQAAAATRRLDSAQKSASMSFGRLSTMLGGLLGAGTLALLGREVFNYSQDLEGTKIAIAGLLTANREYIGTQDQWGAALGESSDLLRKIQVEALKTAATVPQIGDAFATTFGAATAAGIKASSDEILQLTTRLTQTGNAFRVPMEQMRQEINSLLTGQITEDSLIAKRLGFDNASVKEMVANGTIIAEIIKRTEAYATAAEAQSNTLRGKLLNTRELIVSTIAQGLEPLGAKIAGLLDRTFGWFQRNGDTVVSWIRRAIGAIETVIQRTGDWAREHQELLKEIGATAVIAGAAVGAYLLIAGAIAVLVSPTTLAIASIVALGVAWHGVSQLSEIEVGGSPIASYMRATATVVTTVWMQMIIAQLAGIKVLYHTVRMIFSGMGEVILMPIHAVVRLINNIIQGMPAAIAKLIPGYDSLKAASAEVQDRLSNLFTPGEHADDGIRTIRETTSLLKELSSVGGENVIGAFADPKKTMGPSDLVAASWGAAKDYLAGMMPELEKAGKDAVEKLFPSVPKGGTTKTDPKVEAAAAKAAEKLRDMQRAYEAAMNDYRGAAAAQGDPLEEELNKITSQRDDVIAKLAEQQRELEKALALKFDYSAAGEDLNQVWDFFDQKQIDAAAKSIEDLNKRTLGAAKDRFAQETEYALEEQRRQNAARIALISDAGEREIAIRVADIDEWFAREKAAILATVDVATIRNDMLANLDKERARREGFAIDEAERQQREQLVGTREWARKMAAEIGTISQQVTRVLGEARLELAGFFTGMLDDLVDQQFDFGESFKGLINGLAKTWTRLLSDMLTKTIVNGESIVSQLKGIWQQLGAAGAQGPMEAGVAGAGVGALIGSIFGGPNNFGAEGGMIGGALGAAVGAYFYGPTGAKVGMMIGSAIGTAIGTMIGKGEDLIRVAIRDGVATVTEKGISAGTARDLQVQVQRRVKEEAKAWQSILDMFPESVREALAKLPKPKINTSGGVDSGDISDAGALGALGDFLGNTLPKAAFVAYSRSIKTALETMGVSAGKIKELFTYWGTLQGKELQDAVRGYVTTLLKGIDLRDKLSEPFGDRVEDSRRMARMTSLDRMGEVSGQIATTVASAAALTDIEDMIAAQDRVNALAQQYYDMGIARLQRIDAIEENILRTNQALWEQIDLAGMDDQEKMNYYYQQLGDLRNQLLRATDPEEIARINTEMQRYIQQAFGLDPGNAENRDKLKKILEDMGGLSKEALEKARAAQEAKDKEVADLLKKQLAALMEIQRAVVGDPPNRPVPPPGTDPGGDPDGPGRGGPGGGGRGGRGNSTSTSDQMMLAMMDVIRNTSGATTAWATALPEQIGRSMAMAVDPAAIGKAVGEEVTRALHNLRVRAEDSLIIDNGDLGEAIEERVTRNVILTLTANPDATSPRT